MPHRLSGDDNANDNDNDNDEDEDEDDNDTLPTAANTDRDCIR